MNTLDTDGPQILLIGSGGHARACIDVIEQQGQYRIQGLVCGDGEGRAERHGLAILGTDTDLPGLRATCAHALIAVGQIQSPDIRLRLHDLLLSLRYSLPAIVSSRAYVSPHATLGAGTIVMHGAIVNAGAVVGVNCIINSRALVEHDARVGNHCHISTGAILNGGASVGDGSFIGSASVLREGVTVGQRCLVGMAQAVRHHLGDFSHYPVRTPTQP